MTTAGICVGSRSAYLPVQKRKSIASLPSRTTMTSFARLALRSARSVNSSSVELSSTRRIVFSLMAASQEVACPRAKPVEPRKSA